MAPQYPLITTVGLGFFLVALLAPIRADDRVPVPPTEYPPGATNAQKREIDLLRVRDGGTDPAVREKLLDAYPFESLEDRLRFDAPGRKRIANTFPTPELDLDKWHPLFRKGQAEKIPPAAYATLLAEDRLAREEQFDRIRALAALHQVEVKKFVTNPGFGKSRLIAWRVSDPNEAPPADWSESDLGEPVTLPKTGSFFTAGSQEPTLPSLLALAGFHSSTAHAFSWPDSWGLVKDRTQVAGFRPHRLQFAPDARARKRLDTDKPIKDKAGRFAGYPLIERWAVRRLELIGLLLNESPVVYLNPEGELPSMAVAREAKTRTLTMFEANALKDLAVGKEVVAVDAVTNQVRMVGAIRMAGACTKCHEGQPGDLLGAFSYELVRVPAYTAVQK